MDEEVTLTAGSVAPQDRRPTAMELGAPVTLTPRGGSFTPPWSRVTSASVVAFTPDGMLVVADLERGLDLPGGHTQRHEQSAEETARREAWEETRVVLEDLAPIEVIESDYFGADDLTYMVIFAARVHHLAPWTPGDDEAKGRLLMAPGEFLARYTAGDRHLMSHLVTAAQAHIRMPQQNTSARPSERKTAPMIDFDPRQHLLSTRRHLRDASDAAVSNPVTFAEEAAELRENLAGAPDAGVEALVSAALLKEFAARLRHDLTRDAVAPDAEQLAQVADDLAERLYKAGGLTD
ncbi:NUDIX hydrolase [Streptomyces sp. LZ34]